MYIDANPQEARAILDAMLAVAQAGPAVTDADRASIAAAARYIFRLDMPPGLAGLAPPTPEALRTLAARPELANEAVSFSTVMAFVDGTLDRAKLDAVLRLAGTLGVKADFVDDIAKVAAGRIRDATGHMIRANMESLIGKPLGGDDAMKWLLPYRGAGADPALAARFHKLKELPAESFGRTFADFYTQNRYAFPGEATALNFAFATAHDSAHVLAGYDTHPRGELLVSTFTAAMHRSHGMDGHVLPVIFSWHLGIALNEVAGAAKGALDPQEFWHAWARGEATKVDLFGPAWDFWAATARPIAAVRSDVGISS
jgi:hypothetical protein